jgi:hypothetical protein
MLFNISAVRHFVKDRLRIGPQPGNWPEETTKNERQQTERLNGLCLRMMALLGDLLRKDMNKPEDDDAY